MGKGSKKHRESPRPRGGTPKDLYYGGLNLQGWMCRGVGREGDGGGEEVGVRGGWGRGK